MHTLWANIEHKLKLVILLEITYVSEPINPNTSSNLTLPLRIISFLAYSLAPLIAVSSFFVLRFFLTMSFALEDPISHLE